MPYSVGVDLGTTSVTAAVCDENGVRVVTLGDRTPDTPAAVYLQHDGGLITGRRAASKSVSTPGRVARQFTRLLGSPDPVIIGGQPFTPSELIGVLLGNVVHHVTALEGAPPDSAVLTHPVSWDAARLDLLREVAAGAGLTEATLVSAPAAAASHWAAGQDADDATVAVYDLGGGTFDTAVLRGTGMSPMAGAVGRDLGGMDFDEQLLGLVDSTLGGAVSALDAADPSNATVVARIRQDCVRAKEALSGVPEAYVPVFLPGRHADVRVRRTDLDKLVGRQIEATADELAAALAAADVEARELSVILLIGGSARIPLVARTVSQRLGRVVTIDADSPVAVAAGAAAIGGAARGWPVAGRDAITSAAATDAAARAGVGDGAGAGAGFGAATRGRHSGPTSGPAAGTEHPVGPARHQSAGAAGTNGSPGGASTPPDDAAEPGTSGPAESAAGPGSAAPPGSEAIPGSEADRDDEGTSAALEASGSASAAGFEPPPEADDRAGAPAVRPASAASVMPVAARRTPPPLERSARGHSPEEARRRRILAITGGVLALVVVGLWGWRPWQDAAPPGPSTAELVLTTNTVRIQESYFAYASGFQPDEPVELSWSGPTSGVMGPAQPADDSGALRHGPVVERDPPGAYKIVARGMVSGWVATAPLEVVPER